MAGPIRRILSTILREEEEEECRERREEKVYDNCAHRTITLECIGEKFTWTNVEKVEYYLETPYEDRVAFITCTDGRHDKVEGVDVVEVVANTPIRGKIVNGFKYDEVEVSAQGKPMKVTVFVRPSQTYDEEEEIGEAVGVLQIES